jgi:hypothetical protein
MDPQMVMDFFIAFLLFVFEFSVDFGKERALQERQKKRLQRVSKNPVEPIVWAFSGNSIS